MKKLILFLLFVPGITLFPFAVPYSNLVLNQLEFSYNKVTGSVQDGVLKGCLELEVKNLRDSADGRFSPAPEAAWILFLPHASVVPGMSILMGKQWVPGKLVSRASAAATWDAIVPQARFQGRDPGLLEEIGPDMYRLRVFPVTNTMAIKVFWYAPLQEKNGKCTLRLNGNVSGKICAMAADTIPWYFWTKIRITNEDGLVFQKEYRMRDMPLQLVWNQPGKRVRKPTGMERMLSDKQRWLQQWEAFRKDSSLKWESLAGMMQDRRFVGPGASLIAVEPGLAIRPGVKRGELTVPPLGRLGVDDGYGGFNGQLLRKKDLDMLLRLRKPYYRKILDFYQVLETRAPVRMAAAFVREKFFNPELGPDTLADFCFTANISTRELDVCLSLSHHDLDSRRFDFAWRRDAYLKILTARAARNPLLPLYKLHVLCDFAQRFNLYRYGVTPWDLFLALDGK